MQQVQQYTSLLQCKNHQLCHAACYVNIECIPSKNNTHTPTHPNSRARGSSSANQIQIGMIKFNSQVCLPLCPNQNNWVPRNVVFPLPSRHTALVRARVCVYVCVHACLCNGSARGTNHFFSHLAAKLQSLALTKDFSDSILHAAAAAAALCGPVDAIVGYPAAPHPRLVTSTSSSMSSRAASADKCNQNLPPPS